MLLDAPTTHQTVLVTSLTGIAGAVLTFYIKTGRNWSKD